MIEKAATVIVLLLLLVCGFWAHFAAPCDLWQFSKAGAVPARCLMK